LLMRSSGAHPVQVLRRTGRRRSRRGYDSLARAAELASRVMERQWERHGCCHRGSRRERRNEGEFCCTSVSGSLTLGSNASLRRVAAALPNSEFSQGVPAPDSRTPSSPRECLHPILELRVLQMHVDLRFLNFEFDFWPGALEKPNSEFSRRVSTPAFRTPSSPDARRHPRSELRVLRTLVDTPVPNSEFSRRGQRARR
jgi:hypothetical protein